VDATLTPGPDRGRGAYRRRQRLRAIIAWSTLVLVAAAVAAGIAFGGGGESAGSGPLVHLFSWEMSSDQYERLHKGEREMAVLQQVGTAGLQEDEVQEGDLLRMFPPPPHGSSCSFWKLSDAPDHLVRLCFSDSEGVLLQKAVRAPGESGAETTLA
jgi:hypothetical protein